MWVTSGVVLSFSMQNSLVIASEEWPRSRAAVSESTRRSIKVATVLRKVCGVTQSKPVSARIVRHRRSMLPTWCQVPLRVAKTAL